MDITSIATSKGGALQSAAQTWPVTAGAQANARTVYRAVLFMRFPTEGKADRIVVSPSDAVLTGAFEPLEYNVLESGGPAPAAQMTDVGSAINGVIVRLEAPRQVIQVRLSNSVANGADCTLEFYRVDGSQTADKPTTTANISNHIAVLGEEFTDAVFAIKLKDPSQADAGLVSANILEVKVRSYPTGARIGIAEPDALSGAVFFKQIAGEAGKGATPLSGSINSGAEFSEAIQRRLNDAMQKDLDAFRKGISNITLVEGARTAESSSALPQVIDVAIVIESDAPCRIQIASFNLPFHFVLESFPAREEKQILRYTGDKTSAQTVLIQLPRGARATSAMLKVVESFSGDRSLNAGPTILSDASLSPDTGVLVGLERWVAQLIIPDQATLLSGVSLGLMAIIDSAELAFEIQEDFNGRPSGQKLAEGKIRLNQVGRPGWVTQLFTQPVILPSQPHWLLIKAAVGQAIWLTKTGNNPLLVLEGINDAEASAEVGRLGGVEALYQLFSKTNGATEKPPSALSIGAQVVEAIADSAEQKGSRVFDVTSALNAFITDQPASSSVITIPLAITASIAGVITVYPPTIEYDRAS